MKNKQTPEIRLPGFLENWKLIRLSELMEFSNGINAPKENYGKGRKMISVMDILADEPIIYENIRNSVEVDDITKNKNKVEKGDLVFVRSSEIPNEVGWTKAYQQESYALYSGFSIRGKKKSEFDEKFIELSLNYSNRKQIESKAGGSTRFNVSQSILNSIEILEASIEEQKEVGYFFRNIEETIALHQQELDILKQTKQGFLQKMFPKEGEKVPEVRFPGFSSDWEKRKLDKILKERKVKQKISKEVPLLAFAAGQGVIDRSERKTNNRDFLTKDSTKKTYLLTKYDDIVYNPSNLKYGAIDRNKHGQGVISPIYVTFETDEIPSFVELIVKSENFKQRALQYEEGTVTKRQSVKPENLLCLNVILPSSKDEQMKIGNFFEKFNDTIALHQRELDALKEMKKAFLQKMFV